MDQTHGVVRPQTRYGYAPLQAYYKHSAGSIVASGVMAYRLTTVSTCRTTTSCVNGADETRTTIGYGSQSAGIANQLLPVSSSIAAGDGSLSATASTTWDAVGNPTYVDGPLAGSADTTCTIYDIEREVVGVIAPDPDPDPDGAGALRSAAVRTSYNADGQVMQTEFGSTAGQSDTDWANFASSQAQASTYDVSGRKVTDAVNADGSKYALTDYYYDTVGRLSITAARMSGQGSDRIVQTA